MTDTREATASRPDSPASVPLPEDARQANRGHDRHSRARRWVVSLLALALVAGMAALLWRSPEELAAFGPLSVPVVLVALLLQFVSQLLSSAALLVPLRAHVAGLGFWEFFVVRTGGFFAGYIVPVAGGVAVRLSYLRKRGVSYSDFAWATLASNVLALAAAAVLAVCATGGLWLAAGPPAALVLGLSTGVLALSLAALAALRLLPRLARACRLPRWRWLSEVGHLTVSRRTIASVFGLSLARHCLNFATFGWLYGSLSVARSSFLTGGLVYAIASPLRTIPITPGNLGVDEWVAAMVGRLLAFDLATGLIVALVFRGLVVLAQGLGVLVASVRLARRQEARAPVRW